MSHDRDFQVQMSEIQLKGQNNVKTPTTDENRRSVEYPLLWLKGVNRPLGIDW